MLSLEELKATASFAISSRVQVEKRIMNECRSHRPSVCYTSFVSGSTFDVPFTLSAIASSLSVTLFEKESCHIPSVTPRLSPRPESQQLKCRHAIPYDPARFEECPEMNANGRAAGIRVVWNKVLQHYRIASDPSNI
ncbi:uncharacterized protein ARMOST_15967 [Armillaria ostoyae]|uniref:Uncharacterized protein n=1 Tax=Armillaria ostoyae TaxID=47428 RepID=A0A284RUU0_ARMOS|nr:uncharacterized protein ARMOST_15967 [Armillaria ostoyae]